MKKRIFFFSQSIKTACSWLDETWLELTEGNPEHSADSSLRTRRGHPNTCRARNQHPQQPEHLFFKTFGHTTWDFSSLTRDQTCTPGPPGKPQSTYFKSTVISPVLFPKKKLHDCSASKATSGFHFTFTNWCKLSPFLNCHLKSLYVFISFFSTSAFL